MASPKLEPVVLTDEERQVLEGWARRGKTAQALALRSRIVLACAAGGTVGDVAAGLGSSRAPVPRWRSRFLASRLDGLSDELRPGRPRTVTDEHVEKVITATPCRPMLPATPARMTHDYVSSAGSPSSPAASSADQLTAASPNSKPTS